MNLSFLMEKRHSYFISMILLWTSFSLVSQSSCAQNQEKIICNGIPWFDDQGKIVNAHGACIVEDAGRYYLFGEYRSDETNSRPTIYLIGNLNVSCFQYKKRDC